jgi:cytochrome P450
VTLTFALYYVLDDRRVWEKLSDEVRSKFKTMEEISGPSTAALPYLNAVIQEALRIRPVAAAGQPRETPPEGAMIAGRYIAGNVISDISPTKRRPP